MPDRYAVVSEGNRRCESAAAKGRRHRKTPAMQSGYRILDGDICVDVRINFRPGLLARASVCRIRGLDDVKKQNVTLMMMQTVYKKYMLQR
jgi:hypothetical protein